MAHTVRIPPLWFMLHAGRAIPTPGYDRALLPAGGDAVTQPAAEQVCQADLREALTNMAASAARMPEHWTDRKAELHRQINDLLDDLERAPA